MLRTHGAFVAAAVAGLVLACGVAASALPTCPVSYGATDAAKSHKLYLYFPASDDAAFPNFHPGFQPAKHFDVAQLSAGIGTTAQLRDRIFDIVSDDYCEFNVQVLQTTTAPPTTAARRATIAIGSDNGGTAWGQARDVDTNDAVDVDYARVWAGTYTTCEGWSASGCTTGSLTGANATLDRWAQAIGGTAAHEAGHTYGLWHTDDDPTPDPLDPAEAGFGSAPGEDAFNRHLMPAGRNLTGEDRASYRRHFSDRTFGMLAQNVGLTVQTMHNWDLMNPNGSDANAVSIDFLSPLSSLPVTWPYNGPESPWINPVVTGPSGTATWKGMSYNRFTVTWSAPNSAFGTPGLVPAGSVFHIGVSFPGVDYDQPDPVIIQNITLFSGATALGLHPRLPAYDAGTADAADGTFHIDFFPALGGSPLIIDTLRAYQLPRVASIDSMVGSGAPYTFDRQKIRPWSGAPCKGGAVREQFRCTVARLGEHHVIAKRVLGQRYVVDCSKGTPNVNEAKDSQRAPDFEGPICAGTITDPFPSTTVYAIATVVDPAAKHWDRASKSYVTGPVRSKIFVQVAGIRHRAEIVACRRYERLHQQLKAAALSCTPHLVGRDVKS